MKHYRIRLTDMRTGDVLYTVVEPLPNDDAALAFAEELQAAVGVLLAEVVAQDDASPPAAGWRALEHLREIAY